MRVGRPTPTECSDSTNYTANNTLYAIGPTFQVTSGGCRVPPPLSHTYTYNCGLLTSAHDSIEWSAICRILCEDVWRISPFFVLLQIKLLTILLKKKSYSFSVKPVYCGQ